MEVLSLEQSTLINLAERFWMREGKRGRLVKQTNGLVQMENALEDLKKSVFDFCLSANLKKLLIEMIERVGYELYIFVMRSPVDVFQSDFDLTKDIAWSPCGAINENLTYNRHIDKNLNRGLVIFKCACLICAEEIIKKVWTGLSGHEREELKRKPSSNLLTSYWLHFIEDRLGDFISTYGSSILGFEPFRSIQYNMAVYSVNSNFKIALSYFLNRVPDSEKQILMEKNFTLGVSVQILLLRNLLKNPKPEHFRYICSFLEKPTADSSEYDLIVNGMPDRELEEFINHVFRQVNLFGDLHYNIFRRIIKMAGANVKKKIISKLDFYVLSLLSKGRFETFENLLTKKSRTILFHQLCFRLRNSKGLAPFFTILRNNQQDLLIQLFEYLSETEEDEKFFRTHLDSILNGCQYDDFSY